MLFLSVSSFYFCKRLQEGSDALGGTPGTRKESTIPNAVAYTSMPLRGAPAPPAVGTLGGRHA
jgi:hypothetical protein